MLNILLYKKQPRVFVHAKCTNDELRGMATLTLLAKYAQYLIVETTQSFCTCQMYE